ncbi:transglutaminase N-terminal domain-containing protein, partial [Burkholderia cenocepacia]
MVTTKGVPKTPAGSGSGNARQAAAPTAAASDARAAVAPGRLLRVTHDTEYRYAARVESAQHQARLQPLATPRQQVLSFSLDIEPAPESVGTELDAFGNARASFALNLPHDTLLVRSRSTVRVTPPVWSLGARGEPPPA